MSATVSEVKSPADTTPVLELVPFGRQHFSELAGWFSSEAEVVQWGGPALTHPLDATQLMPIVALCQGTPPQRLAWMVRQGADWVGHVELGLDWRNGNALLSRVGIAPVRRGHGLARPMIARAVAIAFAFAEIMRVELNVYAFNTAAIRTYERFGFVIEGTRRSSTRVGAERWDTVGMGLLRSEWEALGLT